MTDEDLDKVRQRIAQRPHRVKTVRTGVGRVVVKRQRPVRGAWRTSLVNLLARAVGLPWLRAVPAHGGARSQAIEVARLRALAAAGIRVPPVLHVDPEFIVLGFLDGPSLVREIEQGGAAGRAAWQRGLASLADVHARGGCLSHAFARNMIVTADGLAMIDFEDDPLEVLTLDEAQARDWLTYLHSTAWLLDDDLPTQRAAAAACLDRERPAVRGLVADAGRRIAPLRRLPRRRGALGREVAGAAALAALFPLPAADAAGGH